MAVVLVRLVEASLEWNVWDEVEVMTLKARPIQRCGSFGLSGKALESKETP